MQRPALDAGVVRREGPQPARATYDRPCGPRGQVAAAVTARYHWVENISVRTSGRSLGSFTVHGGRRYNPLGTPT
jgi:hypothetical protein